MTIEVVTGTIKWFDNDRGLGFIKRDDGEGDVFLHYMQVKQRKLGIKVMFFEGNKFAFAVTDNGRGPMAIDAECLDEIIPSDNTVPSAATIDDAIRSVLECADSVRELRSMNLATRKLLDAVYALEPFVM